MSCYRARVLLRAVLAATLLAGCSGDAGPTGGVLNLELASPYTDDGGLLLSISGGPVDSIDPAGHRLFSTPQEADTVRLILTGQLEAGTIARIHIPDVRQASQYSAAVSQAAARLSYLPRDPASYTVTLRP